MNQDKFEALLLDRLDKLDSRFDKIDGRMTALENKLDEKTSAIENRIGNLEQTTAWIKGKLEGRSDVNHIVLTSISIFVAICAVVVAWLK